MKRVFSLLLIAGMTLGIACTPEEPAETIFNLTSASVMQFPAEGGTGEITYSLENPVEGTNVTATSDADWITDITVGETISFTVAPNESYDERSERITISYGEDMHFVGISQRAKEVGLDEDLTMPFMVSYFYDKNLSMEKIHQYYVALCDQECEMIEDQVAIPLGSYFCHFFLCADITPEESNNKIPNGTYVFDAERTLNHGTIDSYNCFVYDRNLVRHKIVDATVTVSDNHIEILFESEDGKVIKGTYDGALDISAFPN